MATPPPLPNPLGNSAPDPMPPLPVDNGAVIPVRLVYTAPIPVRVVGGGGGGGGGRGPLDNPTGKRLASVFDRLPRELTGVLGRGERYGRGAERLVGTGTGIGTAAGLGAAAGIGFFLAGLSELKGTFIDPLVGAAKGGFQAGITKGSGAEALGESFKLLGVGLGALLLPTVIRLSAAAIGLAGTFDQMDNTLLGSTVGSNPGMDLLGYLTGNQGGGWLESATRAGSGQGTAAGDVIAGIDEKLGGLGLPQYLRPSAPLIAMTGKGFGQADAVGQKEKSALADVVTYLKQSVTPPAQTLGVADVRAAVQAAALNRDPLEERARQAVVKGIEDAVGHLRDINASTKGRPE